MPQILQFVSLWRGHIDVDHHIFSACEGIYLTDCLVHKWLL